MTKNPPPYPIRYETSIDLAPSVSAEPPHCPPDYRLFRHDLSRESGKQWRAPGVYGLPRFAFRGRRFRPRVRLLREWRRPTHVRDDYGQGRAVHRLWAGPLLITIMVDGLTR